MGVTGSATQSSVGDQSVATLASSSLRSVMLEYDGLSFDLSKGFYDYYQFKIFDFERNLIFKNDKENRQKCRFNTVLGYMTSFLSEEQKSIMQSQPKDSTSPMFTTWLSKVKTLSLQLQNEVMAKLISLENASKTVAEIAKQRTKYPTFSAVYERMEPLKLTTSSSSSVSKSQVRMESFLPKGGCCLPREYCTCTVSVNLN